MIKSYEPQEIEKSMLDFWSKNNTYASAKQKNIKAERFYFLDGPPYTSGKLHIGHAWNYSMKDMFLRFKRMSGINVWDRPGYDTHGLPTAHAVQDKLKLKSKEDIEKYGLAKFVTECKNLCAENLELMKASQKRLGVWMDFDNPYVTFKDEFIEGEWWLIKKAHENNRLYEGEKVMHWCSQCATAMAKHELEYKNVTDNSIFLKFKVKGTDNEYLIIWTTTPWTIPYNLGVMVNPGEEYVKAKVGDEIWIVAAKLAGVFIQGVAEKQYKILKTIKGEELEGLEYIHPLHDELKDIYDKLKQESPNTHTVLLSQEYVDTSSGSGLVHCAPGCGPEDYEIGHKYHILPFNNLKEDGSFPEEMGIFKGFTAKKDDKKFIEYLERKGAVVASNPVEHEYAHCWRCKSPVIFRTTKQWFFKIEDLKDEMRKLNKNINWQPDWAGNRQFDSWLDNLRDNSITRQRYWGCPVPIWRCDKCDDYIVVGSKKELEELGDKKPKELHIPWIDEVQIKCKKCNETMKRVPDILDVWVDAGTTSWTCLDYPQNEKNFKELWPADFILEGKDQIRGWFNLLFVASMVSMNKPSYKSVYMHGFINDAQGRKMSKSLGNYILPNEVIEKYGADTLRYYAIGGANPGLDLNYNFEDMKIKYRNLVVLWNLHKLLIDMSKGVEKPENAALKIEEDYIISKLHSTIQKTTELFDNHQLNEIPLAVEDLFLELSRTYIQIVRDKSATGLIQEKQAVLYAMYHVLMDSLKLFAPVCPFITEQIYQNLKEHFNLKEESIHLLEWPKADVKKINKELEQDMEIAKNTVQSILSARDKMQRGIRWPLKQAIVETKDKNVMKAVEKLSKIIKTMAAVKEISIVEELPGVKPTIKLDYAKLKPEFGQLAPKIIANFAMESTETIMRHIDQDGTHTLNIDGDKVEITKDHLMIEKQLPTNLVEAEFKFGAVYVDKELTPELEAEGYSRELMRKLQSLRKKAGLDKQDNIDLAIKTEKELADMLNKHLSMIQEKVGAEKLEISTQAPSEKYENHEKDKLKIYDIEVWFSKQ